SLTFLADELNKNVQDKKTQRGTHGVIAEQFGRVGRWMVGKQIGQGNLRGRCHVRWLKL
ncbi:hypothetical protein DYB28_008714, partial [Aphanomyces astaci]